jgi:hypothetical protein
MATTAVATGSARMAKLEKIERKIKRSEQNKG